MVHFVKTAQEKLFVLIQWILFLNLVAVWGVLAIAFSMATLGCVFLGVTFVFMQFLDDNAPAGFGIIAAGLSLPLVLWRFLTIFKKENNWGMFGR